MAEVQDGVSPERIEDHTAACRLLVGRVPVLENPECGPNLTDRAGSFTHCTCPYPIAMRCPPISTTRSTLPSPKRSWADVAELRVMDVEV